MVTGAGTKLGEYGAKKGIEFCEDTAELIGKEWEAGWERDKEAGGFSSCEDDYDTASASA